MLNTIRHQTRGAAVKAAQYLLNYAERGKADGNFSANFVAYVVTWQHNHKLDPDGVIGPATWAAIAAAAPTCSTAKNRTSRATCALQELLGGLEADGIFGSKTKKAVAAFQSASGLSPDGICGPKTWNALIVGKQAATGDDAEPATEARMNECVHYVQWDKKWKNKRYSTHTDSQTIGNSGCGPTAMADIAATWVDPKLTPVELCALALDGGFRTYNSGTSRNFFKAMFEHYGSKYFRKFVRTSNLATLTAAIREGALAVCSVNDGDSNFWTSGGHFITVIGVDDTYIYANDPNKKAAPRKQKLAKFKRCMNEAMIFWRAEEKQGEEEDA